MVHVVLHLRDDPAEVGDEAAEDAGIAQPLQGRLGQPLVGQHLDEQPVGLGVGAQPGIDQSQVLLDQPQRLRMDVDALALRLMEQPQHQHRILGQRLGAVHRQPVAVDRQPRRQPAEQRARQRRQPEAEARLLVLIFQNRAEHPGQVADRLGDAEVVLHEALDAAARRPVVVAQAAGDHSPGR